MDRRWHGQDRATEENGEQGRREDAGHRAPAWGQSYLTAPAAMTLRPRVWAEDACEASASRERA